MHQMILHHYPQSPFAEKIRLLLGYKQLSYAAVTIPVIMPKPDLMPLTGGYRKTPVLQIGADIYCDTALIARVIDRLSPAHSIYPAEHKAVAIAAAQWTDSVFFKVCVSVAFQPRAIAENDLFKDPAVANAFLADRAKLTEGSSGLSMDLDTAMPWFLAHLGHLDRQLATADFLLGDTPCIVDFATYHCLWFVYSVAVLRDLFAPYARVTQWLARMSAFGHGQLREIDGSEALKIAHDAQPQGDSKSTLGDIDHLHIGDDVEVLPTDYGFQPVRGKLKLSSLEEIVITRVDEQVGEVAVHFPRLGFRIARQT